MNDSKALAPLNMTTIDVLFKSFVAREKCWRIVQYGARFFYGLTAMRLAKAQEAGDTALVKTLQLAHTQWVSLFSQVSTARRTFRWFSETGLIKQIQNPVAWGKEWQIPFAVSRSLIVGWHILDHVRWLQALKWMQGDAGRTGRISFTLNTFAYVIELYYRLHSLSTVNTTTAEGKKNQYRHREAAIKSALNIVTFGHVAQIMTTHDTVCGGTAVLASMIDLRALWPRV
eukprot:m.85698 g.85698  ORF g.85698 m.85698 type:complete len:229 (-) comp25891_c0_seq2:629-1315(-)